MLATRGVAIGLMAAIGATLAINQIHAEEIAGKGAGHNGAFLHATKTPAAGGIIVTFTLNCRKNWGGESAGAAFIQMVGVQSKEYKQLELRCLVEGGADGATKSSDTTNGLFLPGTEQAVIIATLDHQEKSNWQVWQNNIENTVKTQIKQIIDTATNPTQMLNAAQAAGLAGKLL
ncbi:MAG TPA: hypothetical protein VN692_03725 [Steroidobacteraceae bacterium]|nr:hypothetical protein [Steroidobacteraceae bacterium]